MTQEQKVRTREEQVAMLMEAFGGSIYGNGLRYLTEMNAADLLKAIAEAEARGAAEASANVAALEARVQELEGVLQKVATISSCHAPRKRQGVYLNENKRIRRVSDTARDMARAVLKREGGV